MKTVTLSSKYQVVIPSSARVKLGITHGDKLIVSQVTDTEIILKKQPSYNDLIGVLPTKNTDAVQRVRNQRNSWK